MKSTLTSFIFLTLGTSLLHAQTAAPATTPAAPATAPAATTPPVAKPAMPLSSNDQIIARGLSGTMQHQMLLALTGKRRKDDTSLATFGTNLNARLTKQWTPFVNVCQAHKFNGIAIAVSKNQADDIEKMAKLKGEDFRKEYFKRFKSEVTRGVQMAEQSVVKTQEPELKQSVESMLALFKTISAELDEKSKEPYTAKPNAKAEPKKDPKKK